MDNKNTLLKTTIICGLVFIFASGLVACQAKAQAETEILPTTVETRVESQPPAQQQSESATQATPVSPTQVSAAPESSEPDLPAIEAAWRSSPHADTFILDENGENNTCARCHAPVNWQPTMDDLPESCYTCKFTLQDPPALIPESEWVSIPCKVCHKLDKKNNVQPEIAWLEIAPLDEYVAVASPTELCLKCHAPAQIPGHGVIDLGSAHSDYQCTGCHSPHSTAASCSNANCHSNVTEPTIPVPGHDADHQTVACVACHDGSGMEVGIDEETGLWTTFFTSNSAEIDPQNFPFTSHYIVQQASCDRCHYVGNPWNLSDNVVQP